MKKIHDFYLTQRIIDLLIKVAGVALTSVATYQVAQNTFAYLNSPWEEIVTLGALLLVEGAFVASWFAIDTQKQAPMWMKISWAFTLVTVYGALLIIGLEHGEGSAEWAFRLILAVMIGKSIYASGVYEVLRNSQKEDRDVTSSYKVRRRQTKIAREKTIHAMINESKEKGYALELADKLKRARMKTEHEAAMLTVQLHRQRLLERAYAKDNLARGQLLAKLAHQQLGKRSISTMLTDFDRTSLEMRN